MAEPSVIFRVHAVQRMFERSIRREEVLAVLSEGEPIETYPDEKPHPSRLLLAFVEGRPLHVVAAYDAGSKTTIIVTVYEPDPARWSGDYRQRRKP